LAPKKSSISKERLLAILCGGLLIVGGVVVVLYAVGLSRQSSSDDASPVSSTTLPLATSPWMTFGSPDDSFTAEFPIQPTPRDETIATGGGGTLIARTYGAQSGEARFGVTVAQAPTGVTVDLATVAARFATAGSDEIAYETPSRFKGFDALDVRVDGDGGDTLTTTVRTGNRIVVIEYAAEHPDPAVWQRFRSSVVITPG
jgi:hypothetical protein